MQGGRSTPRLIADALGLYRRYPLLFLVLAAAVIVPYQLIVLAATGGGGFSPSDEGAATEIPLSFFYLLVVGPLVSALHIHAVSDVHRGEEPRLLPIARRGLAVLPVVCAATIMSWLGILGGILLFIVPGLVLWIRWYVVAQTAAIEGDGWTVALRRSWTLTEGSWVHVLVFFVSINVIALAPSLLISRAFVGEPTTVASFLGATALQVVLVSFTALATALLYYDLRRRRELLAANAADADEPVPAATSAPVDHNIDPRLYSDEERPNGWYVDPESPDRMRYWDGGESPGWRGRTRTPRKLRREWRENEGRSSS